MANTTIKTRILLRNDTLANWESSSLALGKGEVAIATLNEGLAEVRVGTGSSTWANSLRLNISADQVSGLTEMISSLVGDGAKKYQVVANGEGGNSWKLQEAALSGGDWSDVTGSTWTVDFTTISNAITGLTADVNFLSGAIDAVSGVVNTISSDYLTSTDKAQLTGADAYISGQVDALSTTLNTVSSDYLKASDFAELSNEIGLSAASASNPVVTKDDIKDIAGAMHFKGAVDSLDTIVSADPGDVVIITSTSKEYVYNGSAGAEYDVNNWVELGDEALYATKAEVSTISAELTGDIAELTSDVEYLSGQIGETNTTLNTVSSDYLKAADKTELETLVGTVSAETLVSANAYTDTKFAGLSDYYTKTEVDAISTALSTDYVGKIKEVDDKLSDYALKTEAAEMSAYAYGEASAYTNSEIAKLSIDRFALSANVDTLVSQTSAAIVGESSDTSASNTIYGAKAYADDKVNELSSGFLILDCGASSLRDDEPTPPFSA